MNLEKGLEFEMDSGAERFTRSRGALHMALIVTRREVRDSFRDWRIIIPILLLTLFFPFLMNFVARLILGFVSDYGAEIIGTSLIPFLLLVVGFFPTSFALVIALETFVGEKERNSLEPLLATPLTNAQIYLGKMIASMIPPLSASYLGIGVYLLGLWVTIGWRPTIDLLLQTVLLTTVQGVVMVAAAVVISSQTTSTRAANLLASFIIVPMALLVQVEAVVMFWGEHGGLWWLILTLVIIAILLIRTGIHVFNREELLGRDIDHIRLGWAIRTFWQAFTGRSPQGAYPGLRVWYRRTMAIVPRLGHALFASGMAILTAAVLGVFLAQEYTLPAEIQELLRQADFAANLAQLEGTFNRLPLLILFHNIRVILIAAILGAFSFGVIGVLVFMLPWALIGYVAAQLQFAGESATVFLVATIAPHATLELPALLLMAAAALKWHTAVIARDQDKPLSEIWICGLADFLRLFIAFGAPLLLLAAIIEAHVTPTIVQWIYR